MQKAGASAVIVRLVRIQGIYAYQMGGMYEPAFPDIQADVGYTLLPVRPYSAEEKEVARPEFPVCSDIAGGYSSLQFIDVHHFTCKNLIRGISREKYSVQKLNGTGKAAAVE